MDTSPILKVDPGFSADAWEDVLRLLRFAVRTDTFDLNNDFVLASMELAVAVGLAELRVSNG